MNKWLFMVLATASTPAFAHEGHGIDVNSILHYLSAPHIALPLGLVILGAGTILLAKKYSRNR